MKRFHRNQCLAMLLFPLISAGSAFATSSDPKLLSLIPPGAQVVAGTSVVQSTHGQPNSFVVITHNNTIDLRDFSSLAGVDDSRVIHQMIFVASSYGKSIEHSLLVNGHFDQTRIFKAAVQNGSSILEFKGIRVLVVQPFQRDLRAFKDVRWLAILESNVALFGTIPSVQQELDRYFARSAADPFLMEKIARLRRDDAAWCVLSELVNNDEVQHALSLLDPLLANLVQDGDSFQFGIRYGKQVELEYEITAPSSATAQAISDSLAKSLVGDNGKGSSLLPSLEMTGNRASVHGAVKVSRTRYQEWLNAIAARGLSRTAAARGALSTFWNLTPASFPCLAPKCAKPRI